ncbi:MAG: DUF4097 family beta strand repeat-containing protein [Tissierellia bacterium]|nr:DUF4097 family beta strand repeat-containing protein [Tissierellia bacterium]
MSKEKLLVLNMLKEGKITEEEALRLLEAMGESESEEEDKKFKDFEDNLENIVGKVTSSVEKIMKKTTETIQNMDFEDLHLVFVGNSGKYKAKTEQAKTMEISEIENPIFRLSNKNGRVQIYPWDNDFIECRSKINYDSKLLGPDHEFFTLKKEDRDIIVNPNYHAGGSQPFELNMQIAVPRRFFEAFHISTTNGSIEASLLDSKYMEVNTVNGKIILNSNTAEDSNFSAMNAKIEVLDHTGKNMKITNTNGKVVVNGLYVEDTEITTTNGNIILQEISNMARRISTISTNGSIRIAIGDFVRGVKVDFQKVNKYTTKVNLSDRFTSVLQGNKDVIAYTEGFNEEDMDSLSIKGSTVNGSVIVE